MDTSTFDLLRDVTMHVGATARYRLQLWDTHHRDNGGRCRTVLAYRLARHATCAPCAVVVFEGCDFRCSALHADGSDSTLRSLLTFLTLQRGDTDADYFDEYDAEQLAFRDGDECEMLQLWANGDDTPEPFVDTVGGAT